MDKNLAEQITEVLSDVAKAFADLMRDLIGIRKKRQELVERIIKNADQKKIEYLKNKIDNLKEI